MLRGYHSARWRAATFPLSCIFAMFTGRMNIDQHIKALVKERDELTKIIDALQQARDSGGQQPPRIPGRRGRKNMGEEERREVSARMRRYWADRHNAG